MNKPLLEVVTTVLDEKAAENIKLYDVTSLSPLTDGFIFATAGNTRKMQAIVDALRRMILEHPNFKLHHIEGKPESGWVLVDLHDLVVHVMTEEARDVFFLESNLERTYKIQATLL
jgi:ribosome-associated protein